MNFTQIQIKTLDKLWEYRIKCRAGFRCEICGRADNGLDAHHLISRRYWWSRWLLFNGVAACKDCHKWPMRIIAKLKEFKDRRYSWYLRNRAKIGNNKKLNYSRIYRRLAA